MAEAPTLEQLIDDLLEREGSDLHIGVGHPPLLRLNGELVPAGDAPLDKARVDALLLKLLDADAKTQLNDDLDFDFTHMHRDKAMFRVNYFFREGGLAAVFHAVATTLPSLDDLRVPNAIKKLVALRSGLVVFAGGVGSGKTTTLAAFARWISETRPCHIVTIEEPAEIPFGSASAQVTRRAVGPHAPSVATALESTMRDDVDVVVVGDLSTREAVRYAVELASSGVLVLACVHATSAERVLVQMTSGFGAEEAMLVRSLLEGSLLGIVVQTLVPAKTDARRLPVFEVLLATPTIRALIRDGRLALVDSAIIAGAADKMQTMDAALARLLDNGQITTEVAQSFAEDRDSFASPPSSATTDAS